MDLREPTRSAVGDGDRSRGQLKSKAHLACASEAGQRSMIGIRGHVITPRRRARRRVKLARWDRTVQPFAAEDREIGSEAIDERYPCGDL